jgi:hypothetical protein
MKGPGENAVTVLMGLARCGTTWVGKILDSHPATLYKHEPDRGETPLELMSVAPSVQDAEEFAPLVVRFVDSLIRRNEPRIAGKQPEFPKAYRSLFGNQAHRLNCLLAKATAKAGVQCPILPMIKTGSRTDQVHIVWKSVNSIGRLGVIVRALPNARAILLIRHPCGQIASVLRGEAERKFSSKQRGSENYKVFSHLLATEPARRRGLEERHLVQLSPIERLTWRWVLFYEKAFEDLAGSDAWTARYEDFCAEPQRLSAQMLEFCELSWNPQTEAFVQASISRESSYYYSIFKDPARAAIRWQTELSDEDINRVYGVVRESDLMQLYPGMPGTPWKVATPV